MSRHSELMNYVMPTQFWADTDEGKRRTIDRWITWARNTMPGQGPEWIARVFRRAFVLLSEDAKGENKWEKKRAEIVQKYDFSRCIQDFQFFVGTDTQGRGQFMESFDAAKRL